MSYVISKWEVSDTGNLIDNNYIAIKGRDSGGFSWLLTLVGIEPSVSISANSNSILFEKGSLSGFEKKVVPITSVSSAYYGFIKPWKEALWIGGVTFATIVPFVIVIISNAVSGRSLNFGTFLLVLFLLSFSLIAGLLFYIFNKTIKLGFVESGGIASGIEFKPSLIEGRKISERDAYRIVNIIQQLIDNSSQPPLSTRDSVSFLSDLNQLYERGIITIEEYEAKRQKILRAL